jgi:hypothetical protein
MTDGRSVLEVGGHQEKVILVVALRAAVEADGTIELDIIA